MTGHLLGGAGGLEAGVTVLALRDQILPPTINLENQDPETDGMDFVPNQARKVQFDYAMSNSFGFGGTNGALLFRKWSEYNFYSPVILRVAEQSAKRIVPRSRRACPERSRRDHLHSDTASGQTGNFYHRGTRVREGRA